MFVIGIYPTIILKYFNGSAVEMLQYLQSLLGGAV
jgi:hypothetical protein